MEDEDDEDEEEDEVEIRSGISKVVDIEPRGPMGLSKGSINAWGSKRGR